MLETLENLVKLIYPEKPKCPLCGHQLRGNLLCHKCRAEIDKFKQLSICQKCGRFLNLTEKQLLWKEVNGQEVCYCAECQAASPPFEAARAVGAFTGVLKDAIYNFKFVGVRSLAPLFASLMLEVLTFEQEFQVFLEKPQEALIVPVPLAKEKEEVRGFNQSFLLAEELAKTLSISISDKILIKNRNTPTQSKMLKAWRKENLAGAFSLQNTTSLEGKSILLIDDIFTTGTTVKECCKVLKLGGAKAVFVMTICTGFFDKI